MRSLTRHLRDRHDQLAAGRSGCLGDEMTEPTISTRLSSRTAPAIAWVVVGIATIPVFMQFCRAWDRLRPSLHHDALGALEAVLFMVGALTTMYFLLLAVIVIVRGVSMTAFSCLDPFGLPGLAPTAFCKQRKAQQG